MVEMQGLATVSFMWRLCVCPALCTDAYADDAVLFCDMNVDCLKLRCCLQGL